jgi:hypothetical protein
VPNVGRTRGCIGLDALTKAKSPDSDVRSSGSRIGSRGLVSACDLTVDQTLDSMQEVGWWREPERED